MLDLFWRFLLVASCEWLSFLVNEKNLSPVTKIGGPVLHQCHNIVFWLAAGLVDLNILLMRNHLTPRMNQSGIQKTSFACDRLVYKYYIND